MNILKSPRKLQKFYESVIKRCRTKDWCVTCGHTIGDIEGDREAINEAFISCSDANMYWDPVSGGDSEDESFLSGLELAEKIKSDEKLYRMETELYGVYYRGESVEEVIAKIKKWLDKEGIKY